MSKISRKNFPGKKVNVSGLKKTGKLMMSLNLKRKIRQVYLAFILPVMLLLSIQASAQKLTASVNRNPVGLNEQFQLSFELNANGSAFRPPALNDFSILSGPNQSTSMQFINGSMSQSIIFSYIL